MNKSEELLNYIEEMSTIASTPKFIIRVYKEPLLNPSFHLIKPNEFEIVLTIKDFKKLELKFDKKKRGLAQFSLNSKEKKDLIKLFNEFNTGTNTSNWNALVLAWNLNNLSNKIDTETPPDFGRL